MCANCALPLEVRLKGNWYRARGIEVKKDFLLKSSVKRRNDFKNIQVNMGTVVRINRTNK